MMTMPVNNVNLLVTEDKNIMFAPWLHNKMTPLFVIFVLITSPLGSLFGTATLGINHACIYVI